MPFKLILANFHVFAKPTKRGHHRMAQKDSTQSMFVKQFYGKESNSTEQRNCPIHDEIIAIANEFML